VGAGTGSDLGAKHACIEALVTCDWGSAFEQQERQWLKAWWLKECRVGRDVGRGKAIPQTVTCPKRALVVVHWCCWSHDELKKSDACWSWGCSCESL